MARGVRFFAGLLGFLASGAASAHIGVSPEGGFATGLTHPFIGLFHGHAHGTEMPAFPEPWRYFTGFTIATASLHALGVTAGIVLKGRSVILRIGGAAISLLGAWLVVST